MQRSQEGSGLWTVRVRSLPALEHPSYGFACIVCSFGRGYGLLSRLHSAELCVRNVLHTPTCAASVLALAHAALQRCSHLQRCLQPRQRQMEFAQVHREAAVAATAQLARHVGRLDGRDIPPR